MNEKNDNGSNPFVILYHGSLVHRNGFDLAMEALEKVKKTIPSVRLRVCGIQTDFFEKVMESARQRGLDSNIDYLGFRNLKGSSRRLKSVTSGSSQTTGTSSLKSICQRASSNTSHWRNQSLRRRQKEFRITLAMMT